MIRHISFKHGWFYHYRVHMPKTSTLCKKFPSLNEYLDQMFTDCPDCKFTEGPRSSSLRFNIPVESVEIKGHEVSSLAKAGLESERYKTAHSNVQMTMQPKS